MNLPPDGTTEYAVFMGSTSALRSPAGRAARVKAIATRVRRVVLYARVSDDRRDGASIEQQFDELGKWSDRENWNVVDRLSDKVSASRFSKKKTRAGWLQVMELIESGEVDILVVWEFSRSSRDLRVWSTLKNACIENNVLIAHSGRIHDPADPDDGFILDLDSALSVRESGMTSRRVKRDTAARAENGGAHGALPYGYQTIYNPSNGKPIGRQEHPERGPIFKEIVHRYLDGHNLAEIARWLDGEGILTITGRKWTPGNIRHMLERPAYAGLRVFQGEILEGVTGNWPALITEDDYYRIRARLDNPANDKHRNSKIVKYFGPGLFRCGQEGCTGRMGTKRSNGYAAYYCRECRKGSRKQSCIDAAIEAALVGARDDKGNVICKGVMQRDDFVSVFDSQETKEAIDYNAKADALDAKIEEALNEYENEDGDYKTYKRVVDRFQPKIDEYRKKAKQLATPSRAKLSDRVKAMAGPDAYDKWQAEDIVGRRLAIAELMIVTILPCGNIGRRASTFDPTRNIRIEWLTGVE